MQIDYEKYMPYLEKYDMTDAQKRELLDPTYSIVQSFVDLAWKVDPVSQVVKSFAEDGQKEGTVKPITNIPPE